MLHSSYLFIWVDQVELQTDGWTKTHAGDKTPAEKYPRNWGRRLVAENSSPGSFRTNGSLAQVQRRGPGEEEDAGEVG